METQITLHKERCNLCGGDPACVPACPQQILTVGADTVAITHLDRCPEGCTDCVSACDTEVFSLVEEVHAELGVVPSEKVSGPALAHHVAYLRAEDENNTVLQARFVTLCERLSIPEEQRSLGDGRGHAWSDAGGLPLQLAWELHSEYYFVRAILSGAEDAVSGPMGSIIPVLHAMGTPPIVTCLDVLVVDRPMNPEEVCEKIVCRNRFGARVLGTELAVYTNYEPLDGRERYVVCGTPEAVAEHGAFAVTNIGRIENYYHLLMIPRREERESIEEVHQIEGELSVVADAVTLGIESAGPEQMEAWLKELTVDMTRVVRFNSRFNHVLSATFPYSQIVREGFAAWKERPVAGFDSLSGVILERTESVAEEYQVFLARLDRMQKEISDLVAILRTRVEMSMESQNAEMLQNLDRRSAIQLRLQELAEGLSVIVITYYMTGLAGYIFKALEKKHLIESYTLWTAIFVPIAALTAWYVAHKGVSKIKKKAGKG